jgi:penicillin-binding protein 2
MSCDCYFYRLGLKMGVERFEKWVNLFHFGQKTGIDLPNERAGIAPIRATKENYAKGIVKKRTRERCEALGLQGEEKEKCLQTLNDEEEKLLARESRFTDYDMAASAFGQGQNASTPIQLVRYVGGLANGGYMHTPHLLLKVGAGLDRAGQKQKEYGYQDKSGFSVAMSPDIHNIVKQGMWQAVNAGGTAGAAAVKGFDVCAKTGTAQVASNDRAGKVNKDHAWLMSFAPRDKPELAMVVLTENAGFGGKQSAPRAKPIYDDYLRRTHPDLLPPAKAELAKK